MSCGDSHDVDCSEALDQVYEYLHHELSPQRLELIHQHLEECSHCLAEYDLEQIVRDLVHRSCCTPAPESLRTAVIARLMVIRGDGP